MARTKEAQRRYAAEEVCWSLMLMMELGGLEQIPLEWRKLLADPLEKWAKLCEETGQMKADTEPEHGDEPEVLARAQRVGQ
jgi:hypothetical protein